MPRNASDRHLHIVTQFLIDSEYQRGGIFREAIGFRFQAIIPRLQLGKSIFAHGIAGRGASFIRVLLDDFDSYFWDDSIGRISNATANNATMNLGLREEGQ